MVVALLLNVVVSTGMILIASTVPVVCSLTGTATAAIIPQQLQISNAILTRYRNWIVRIYFFSFPFLFRGGPVLLFISVPSFL